MDKVIKSIEFGLENCEVYEIPYSCFKQLEINKGQGLKDGDKIDYFECTIVDSGNIKGGFDDKYSMMSPIKRFHEYKDICTIRVLYEDDDKKELRVNWFKSGNPYTWEQANKGQTSELINYKELHIKIEPYIPTYNLEDMVDWEIGTVFIDENDNKAIVDGDKFGKYILTSTGKFRPNMKYRLI